MKPTQHIVLLLLVALASGTVIVKSPPEIAGEYTGYVMLPNNDLNYASDLPPISGTVATSLNIKDATGNILLAPRCSAFLVQELMRYQAKYLPQAILMQTPSFDSGMEIGFSDFTLETYNMNDLSLLQTPIIIMGSEDFRKLFDNLGFNDTAEATLVFTPNPWRVVTSSAGWWILSSSLLAFMVASIVFIAIRFSQFVQAKGFQVSIAQVVLLILLLASARNFIAWIIDGGRAFRYTSVFVATSISEIPTGMATLSSLLTIFFLHELVSLSSIRVTTFINRLKVPAIIASIVLMFLQFWVFMARSIITLYASWLDLLSAIYDFVVSLAVIIYFIYVSIIFLKKMASRSNNNEAKKRLSKNLKDIVTVTVALLLRLVVYVVIIAYFFSPPPNYFFTSSGLRYFLWAQHLTIQILVFCLANMFKVPKEVKKLASGTTAGSATSASAVSRN